MRSSSSVVLRSPARTELADVEQRYSDAPPARLRVLTAAGFVAAKLSAWNDRQAPRDLYDLWAMSEAGLIDADAVRVFGALGPLTSARRVSFESLPLEAEWEASLGHQGIVCVGPESAAESAQRAIAAALSS